MKAQRRLLPFLDLICCALGAGVMLFLIYATPLGPPEIARPRILIRCEQVGGSEPRSIGILYREPFSTRWRAARHGNDRFRFVSHEASDEPGVAMLLIENAEAGEWGFRSYVVDYPPSRSDTRTLITIDAIGSLLGGSSKQSRASIPGDATGTILVTIE